MKKIVLALFLAATISFAQGSLAFGSGDNVIGVGLPLRFDNGVHPGVVVHWDHGASAFGHGMFSFGAELGFWGDHGGASGVGFNYKWRARSLTPLFRFGFHPFAIPALQGNVRVANVLDPYVVVATGIGLNWTIQERYAQSDTTVWNNQYVFDTRAGIRWFFHESVNLWAESGMNVNDGVTFGLTLGVGFKF